MNATAPTLLIQLAHQLRQATQMTDSFHLGEESLMTSADLARLFGIKQDRIKPALRHLKELGLIQAIGLSPKRYRFDSYHYERMVLAPDDLPDETQAILTALAERAL